MKKIIDKLAWLTIRDRKVLFARSRGQKIFYVPGGKRESGESDHEALVREVFEETGVTLDANSIRFLKIFEGDSVFGPDIGLKLTCYAGTGDREPIATSEIDELAWFTTADGSRTTEMGRRVLTWVKEAGLID